MWYPELCNNEDSCSPEQTHLFPRPGTKVDVSSRVEGRVVSTDDKVSVGRGIYVIGEHIHHEGHQASIIYNDLLVWIDIEEMHAVGSYCKDV